MLLKNLVMQKQLRIVSRRRLAVCPFSSSWFPLPVVSRVAFSRHLGRLPVHFIPLPGVSVRLLPCGWFVWCFPSGRRLLSAMPF